MQLLDEITFFDEITSFVRNNKSTKIRIYNIRMINYYKEERIIHPIAICQNIQSMVPGNTKSVKDQKLKMNVIAYNTLVMKAMKYLKTTEKSPCSLSNEYILLRDVFNISSSFWESRDGMELGCGAMTFSMRARYWDTSLAFGVWFVGEFFGSIVDEDSFRFFFFSPDFPGASLQLYQAS